jgi:starch phosphorylase
MPGRKLLLEVQPRIPLALERLEDLADNLVYSWDRRVRSLFARLDRRLWEACGASPRLFLRRVSQSVLDEAAVDRNYLEEYRRVLGSFDAYMDRGIRPEVVTMDFRDLPIRPVRQDDGERLQVDIEFPGRTVKVYVWEARIGHISLYLLDTDLPGNTEADRRITRQLYGGGRDTRLEQEMVLGIGGVRVLRRLGLSPTAWHINEGHAAFMVLERAREHVAEGHALAAALELVASGTVFTTHTPVAAGHDIFESPLIGDYLAPLASALGVDMAEFLSLGGGNGEGPGFNMTTLALKGSRFHNGVSRIHGSVASVMERGAWPEIPPEENPITYVTNGIHVPTFLAGEWYNLFDMRFDEWHAELTDTAYWERIEEIPDYQFWSVRKQLKSAALAEVCRRVEAQCHRNGESASTVARITRLIRDPDADTLVMGFARRFATYKRATLLLADPARLARLLNDPERPAVIVFAGKAHPSDGPGQHLIRVIHEFSRRPEFEGRIILLEGYDIRLARQLVSGVDLWLNTPEYPLEASGTSGQKAAINGVINLSVLDGWWDEGFDGSNGWGIVPRDPQLDAEVRNRDEAKDLLDTLEHEVLPLYFERDRRGFSPGWVHMAKSSMKSIMPRFNSRRMVMDYICQLYHPAREQHRRLGADGGRGAEELAAWKTRVRSRWSGVRIVLSLEPPGAVAHGEQVPLEVVLDLNGLEPQDMAVECLVDPEPGMGGEAQRAMLSPAGGENHAYRFTLALQPVNAGLQSMRLRVYPWHTLLAHRFEVGLMRWL